MKNKSTLVLAMIFGVFCSVAVYPCLAESQRASVVASIHDAPPDGIPDSFNTEVGGHHRFLSQTPSMEDRAILEFDLNQFSGSTIGQATLMLSLSGNNAYGESFREYDVYLYSGNGQRDLSDYSIPGALIATINYTVNIDVPFKFVYLDVRDEVQSLLGNQPSFLGVRVDPITDGDYGSLLGHPYFLYDCYLDIETVTQLKTLVDLEIIGPDEVSEDFQAQYKATAYYDDGSFEDVTDLAIWEVEPNDIASIDAGLLQTQELDDSEEIIIYAQYSEGDITIDANKPVWVFEICRRGSALEFDGIDDYVYVGDEPEFNFGSDTDFSICVWVKPSRPVSGAVRIVDKMRSGHTPCIGFELRTQYGYVMMGMRDNEGDRVDVKTNSSLTDGCWQFIAAVADRDGDLQVYYNGDLHDANILASVSNININIPLAIARSMDYNGQYFPGTIDEVAIFNTVLSPEQIQANMHTKLNGSEANLVAYWDFDEGEGQVVYDMSGNGNDGYLGSDPCGPDDSDPNWADSDAPIGLCTQPIANSGPDQIVSAGLGCVAGITLDGSDSNDADGDELTYAWFMDGEEIATGAGVTIELPLGEHTIELIVNDGFEDSEPDEVVITVEDTAAPVIMLNGGDTVILECGVGSYVEEGATATDNCDEEVPVVIGGDAVDTLECGTYVVTYDATDSWGNEAEQVVRTVVVEDTTPPELSVAVEPNVLWPPNGKMVLVGPEWEVSDNCDEEVEVSLVDITMSGAGDISDYVAIGGDGSIYLRAVKSKRGGSRIYTLTYEAVDDSGNATEASTSVTVPHSRKVWRLGRGLVRQPGKQVYRRGVQRRGGKK
ncbi:MAG: DUF5011 domain-containing protein [Planctomycetota bacterium]|nr:MAG: DUF5011 domain-containing protein [Planctomycetota bacterium]